MHSIKKIRNLVLLINLIIGSFSLYASSIGHEYSSEDDASGSRSRSSSGSNFSDGIFEGTFLEFLDKHKDRYLEYLTVDSDWRAEKRQQYLEDFTTRLTKSCLTPEGRAGMGLLEDETGYTRAKITAVLQDIHRSADNAFPEVLLKGEQKKSIGTYRHTYCLTYIKTVQQYAKKLNFLELESSYKDKNKVSNGTKGSVRPDVYWPEKHLAFDYKFWDATIKSTDEARYKEHIPDLISFIEISS
jgi:hypothetical protein